MAVLKDEQWSFSWNAFDHAAYYSDLAPSNSHTFSGLHDFLGGQRFYNEGNLKKAVTNIFKKKDLVWYAIGINNPIDRYEKYLPKYLWQLCRKIVVLENKVFQFEVHLLIFCRELISDAKLLKYPLYVKWHNLVSIWLWVKCTFFVFPYALEFSWYIGFPNFWNIHTVESCSPFLLHRLNRSFSLRTRSVVQSPHHSSSGWETCHYLSKWNNFLIACELL